MRPIIRGASIGDIHLGNTRNKTENVTLNLYKYITPSLFRNLDLFIINGDLFDRDIPFASQDALLIASFDRYLNDLAKEHNVYLYYLKGTYSHDFDQIRTLTKYNKSHLFKYVDKIDVIYNKELDLWMGFIPDDTGLDPIEIEKVLLGKMREMNITELDMLFIHGMFDHQLPVKLEHAFDTRQFKFVKHYIVVNHIHKFSVFENIIAPGSFDRLTHNEEEDKGFITFTITDSGDKSFNFIKNKHAMLFKTFTIDTMDINYWYNHIEEYVKKHKPPYVRLKLNVLIDHSELVKMLKEYGVHISISKPDLSIEEDTIVEYEEVYRITKDNIVDELSKLMDITDTHRKLFKDIL